MSHDDTVNRRALLALSLMASAGLTVGADPAASAGVDPGMTILTPPERIPWKPVKNIPPEASEQADLFGSPEQPGQYLVLVRWKPAFMSAPHQYDTDRLSVVVSGTWFVASGTDFAPDATVAAPAGSFVCRIARTPHYDGVRRGASEPAIIAITGMGPVNLKVLDPGKPLWRPV